jgi:hypothetical protein
MKEDKLKEENRGTERWKMEVNLLNSTLTSLQRPPNFDKV